MSQAVIDQLRELFRDDPNLPTLPDHVRRILDLLKDEDVSFSALAEEVKKDPALALRIVRLANSAAYGQTREVASLERAFSVIGMDQLSAVLAGVVTVGRCEEFVGDDRFDWNQFWGHATATGFIASRIAERLGENFQGAEFLGGLLHDLGYLALARFGKVRFRAAVREAAERNGFLAGGLHQRFGVTVEEAGDVLAEASSLAAETREIIRYHRDPAAAPGAVRPLVAAVSLGNELAHLAGMTFFRGSAEVEVVVTRLPAWELLCRAHPRMAQWDVERLVFELEREYEASQAFVRETRQG